jgi:hypothetical protein
MFASLIEQGKGLQGNYAGEIQQKARNIDLSQIAAMVRQQ